MNRRIFLKNIITTTLISTAFPYHTLFAQEQKPIEPVDYLYKMQNFDDSFPDDYILSPSLQPTLLSLTKRLTRLESIVGHANFMIVNYDTALTTARRYPFIGAFTPEEIALIEQLFSDNPAQYGFMGEQTVHSLTNTIAEKDVIKIPYSGNYLFRELALLKWREIKKILNNQVILTSGVRNVMKQLHLFCKKAVLHEYNLSIASRSIAPPAYSFHSVGDFDVGKPGFGLRNFTIDFTHTKTYAKLVEAGILELRYYDKNSLGVRFEPWHVKV
ncbi:MAG: D-alanyl-D-alanine carboxypeptidase family protein [Desulfovibrionaceae bacterium]|nr:D-alanyl-D-alanine carboxypeptidase family protein [Desulfovibrionaceae bacterium]